MKYRRRAEDIKRKVYPRRPTDMSLSLVVDKTEAANLAAHAKLYHHDSISELIRCALHEFVLRRKLPFSITQRRQRGRPVLVRKEGAQ